MPFYPSLPMQRDYVDPLSAGVLGLGAGLEVGNRALKSQMYGEALAQEREKRQALKEYSQTGDVSKLMTVAPEIGVKMQEAQAYQQKVQLEAIKPGLDLAYQMADGMTPENFQARRDTVVKIFPAMDALLPKTYDEKQIQSQKQAYERMKKLEDPYKAARLEIEKTKAETQRQHYGNVARHQEAMEGLRKREVGIKEGTAAHRAGERPSFADFQNQPENIGLSYSEQVRKFNQLVSEGKETGKATKPLTPKQQAEKERIEAKTKLIKKLTGEPEGGIVHTSDHELTPAEAAALLKQMGQ